MDIKLSKAQLSKIIQSDGFLSQKALLDLAVPLVKDVLPKLATKATSSVLAKFERKISGKRGVRVGKGFILFISNEDMDDSIEIVESLEKSGLLTDGATETVKKEMIKQAGGSLGTVVVPMASSLIEPVASSLIQPVASSFTNAITWKRVRRAGKGPKGRFLPLLRIIWIKIFIPTISFN